MSELPPIYPKKFLSKDEQTPIDPPVYPRPSDRYEQFDDDLVRLKAIVRYGSRERSSLARLTGYVIELENRVEELRKELGR